MNARRLIILAAFFPLGSGIVWAGDVSKGIEEFERHRWMAAVRQFIDVLREDPRNTQAHDYLALAIQQIEMEKRARVHDRRLEILETMSVRLENNRLDATGLRRAITETAQAEANARTERWHAQCQMAAAEIRLGHLPAANDLVLRVLAEEGNYGEAQRLLSDLQSQIHEKLDLSTELSAVERAVLTKENHAYREALQGRDWLGALVDAQGQVQCYGFVLHQSFYKRVLGEDDDVPIISNCFTPPAQRGQGHYPHMLRAVCEELARRGHARSIITCSSDNAASIRGIEKAGFRCVKQVTVWVLAARLIVWRRERRCDHRADGREGP